MHEIHDVPRTPGRSLTAHHRVLTTSSDTPVMTQERTLRLRGMPGTMCHELRADAEDDDDDDDGPKNFEIS